MPPALVFFKITLAIRGLLWFHMNFRIACSSFEKNARAILIGIAILSALIFFFKIALAIRGLFWFHTNYRMFVLAL